MKSYIFKVYSKQDLTDDSYLKLRNQDISILDFSNELCKISFESNFSNKLLNYFLFSNEAKLFPEKADVYEPIKDKFTVSELNKVVDWISQLVGRFS